MKYNCCHRNGELLSLPLQQKQAASLKGTCSKQGSPRSTAARQCDSTEEEENHKALRLPVHKHKSCEDFSGYKQEEYKEI